MRKFHKSILAMAGVSTLAITAPAFAQDAAAPQEAAEEASSDIIVTAQRRQEKVTEVPISITVASQKQLERQQVNNLNDLNRVAPALEIQSAPAQNTGGGGSIRGIGTQSFSPGAVASVGVVVDQVSQGNANISDLFDVSRIEVLKGPQGTLFGLTTSAGVINITTNAPDPTQFSGRVRTELSDAGTAGSQYGQQVVQGVINVPISATSALRVSGMSNTRQGVNRNAVTGDWNDVNRYALRGRFLWNATEDLTVNLIGDWSKGTTENSGDFFTFISNTAANTALLNSCGITPGEGNQTYCLANGYRGSTKAWGGSAQVDYDAGPLTLTSITAYRKTDVNSGGGNIYRADALASRLTSGPTGTDLRLFTQEFRASSNNNDLLEYTIGAFYSNQKTVQQPERFTIRVTLPNGVTITPVNTPGALNEIKDESLSVFGQGTLHASDSLRLILGARYTGGRLSLDRTDAGTGATSFEVLNVDKVSWKTGVQYDIARDIMAYATAARGFKGGQIAVPTAPLLPYVVQPEIPMSYEAGLKATLFGGAVLDVSLFYSKIKNFQAQECNVNPTTAQLVCAQTNIDGVKTRGAEVNLFGQISDRLSMNTGFIYTKATYPGGFIGNDGTDIGGSQLAYSPRYKFTLSGEYEQPLTGAINGFLAVDTIWKSRIRYQNTSRSEETFRPHWTVGGRLGVRSEDERYSAGLFVRNLFNVHEPSILQSNFGSGVGAIYGPQSFRQVGLQLDAKF
ncbi:MAG TPA: TonB-dependent receptor [Sphingobium sp.]|jgi:iron complex outermembrane receptor protein|uniref:TonB-dependent receptor n=1 Tax=unclassified Sphingobium TaxID=2611147 RepID=UPI000EF0A7A3|nr:MULTISPECIES: TonB-dependent receptor [unclassified Sphingobium]WIW90650.1 TonB-dependent receptor [Sphingobium sp. V4]HAF42815.1 TonB-dependent receptor [Sphingobium sp.]